MEIDLSTVGGVSARSYRGADDHAAMADLINRWNRTLGLSEVATAEGIAHNYAHLERCDPAVDMVMVDDEWGTLIGYTRTDWWQVEDGERKYAVFAKLDPAWRESGLARALLEANRTHSLVVAAGHPAGIAKVLEGWAENEREREFADAYRAMGFRPVTYGAFMVRPDLERIPDSPLPPGVEVRPVEESHLRAIWEADNEAFRDHWGHAEATEEDWLRFLDFPHRDETLWKVAWEGDRVVGQVRSFIDPAQNETLGCARGWTEFISTARDWRRRGLARALICESLRELRRRGMREAALGVHTENPNGAFDLYHALGYEVREMSTTYQQPFAD